MRIYRRLQRRRPFSGACGNVLEISAPAAGALDIYRHATDGEYRRHANSRMRRQEASEQLLPSGLSPRCSVQFDCKHARTAGAQPGRDHNHCPRWSQLQRQLQHIKSHITGVVASKTVLKWGPFGDDSDTPKISRPAFLSRLFLLSRLKYAFSTNFQCNNPYGRTVFGNS